MRTLGSWNQGSKDQGTRNSKKKGRYGRITENIYMEIHILGTGKEMRVTKKEAMNAWLGKEMWTTSAVGGVVKALEGQQ